jgi:hypothetical protein
LQESIFDLHILVVAWFGRLQGSVALAQAAAVFQQVAGADEQLRNQNPLSDPWTGGNMLRIPECFSSSVGQHLPEWQITMEAPPGFIHRIGGAVCSELSNGARSQRQ